MDTETASIKYIFLDVVEFTKDRSVEAQSDIIINMNKIVMDAILHFSFPKEKLIVIPTGDGLCIALINVSNYEVHILLSLDIIDRLNKHNLETDDKKRSFSFRI
jgi:hypothetical protein